MTSIYDSSLRRLVAQAAIVVAVVVAAVSLWALWPPNAPQRDWLPAIALFWTLGPPLWFYFEYALLFDNWDDKDAVAQFKDLQGHAAKIWAGMLAFLTGAILLKPGC